MRGVQGGAAVDPGVEVALAAAEAEVVVDVAARRDVERRQARADHPGIEDDRRVGPALVGRDEVDERVAGRLLLAVAAEADVDGELAGARELAGRREQHVQLPLVVDGAAAVEIAVADLGLERRTLPEPERVGRLDVEVPVAEDGRRGVGAARRADLADRERLTVPVHEVGVAACAADELAHPLPAARTSGACAGSALIEGMRRNSASSSNHGSVMAAPSLVRRGRAPAPVQPLRRPPPVAPRPHPGWDCPPATHRKACPRAGGASKVAFVPRV